MKVQFDSITNSIIAFGPNLQGDNIFDGPSDFSFSEYIYISEIPGEFNPNGFERIINQPQICFNCGQEYTPDNENI